MKGGIFLSKREQIIFGVVEKYREGKFNLEEAAAKLGVCNRTILRYSKKISEYGINGIKHRNYGKKPWNKKDPVLVKRYVDIYEEKYKMFNFLHAMEMFELHENLPKISYSVFRKACRDRNLGKVKKRRKSKAHKARERHAEEGFMWQMDGSPEKWNLRSEWSLIAIIDDATSKVPAARFEKSETTWGCMKAIRDAILKNGIPEFILTDKAGWSSSAVKRKGFSQFERACDELGITVICTPSAPSKGRVERLNRSFQDRLIPELDLYGITGMKDSNRYIEQTFIPGWDEKFSVEPRSLNSRYRPIPPDADLNEIFCKKFDRVVGRDHTINFENNRYRVEPGFLENLSRKSVKVHQYEDGSINIYYGQKRLDFKKMEIIRKWKKKWAS